MKRKLIGLFAVLFSLCLIGCPSGTSGTTDKTDTTDTTDTTKEITVVDSATTGEFDDSKTAIDFVKAMGNGWNLGNTLDAYGETTKANTTMSSELCWGEASTTEDIIKFGYTNGYKTIRIPISWYNHISGDDYKISEEWMKRVKTIVNWAMDAGYYVIINSHHDVRADMSTPIVHGEGYIVRNTEADITESKAFLTAIWTQICESFNNSYDEHLIFETLNEPRNAGATDEWEPTSEAEFTILNEYNKMILDIIRASGGNNAKRFVMIPSLCTGMDTPTNNTYFKLPTDSASDKLILTVHSYIMGVDQNDSGVTFSDELKITLTNQIEKLNNGYVKWSVPVVMGETGCFRNRNKTERIKWITYQTELTNKYGISVLYWDTNGDYDWGMGEINRKTLAINEQDFVDVLLNKN